MNKEDRLLSQGSRLRSLREQTGLTREKFSDIVGISPHTLKGWEAGKREITNQKALLLANIFRMLGVTTTPEMILHGTEVPQGSDQQDILTTLSEEDRINSEIEYFKKINSNYVLCKLSDGAMSPFFKEGDIIGGSKNYNASDFNIFQSRVCIIETHDDRKIVRKIMNVDKSKLDVCVLNLEIPHVKPIETVQALSLALVTRHWRLSEIV